MPFDSEAASLDLQEHGLDVPVDAWRETVSQLDLDDLDDLVLLAGKLASDLGYELGLMTVRLGEFSKELACAIPGLCNVDLDDKSGSALSACWADQSGRLTDNMAALLARVDMVMAELNRRRH